MTVSAQAPYPAKKMPGSASISKHGSKTTLKNGVIALSISVIRDKVEAVEVLNLSNNVKVRFDTEQLFHFVLSGGQVVNLSDLRLKGAPQQISTKKGKQVKISLINVASNFSVDWELVLDNDKNFVRQFLEVSSSQEVEELVALPISSKLNPEIMGTVDGSPVVAGNLFWAIENPFFVAKDKNSKKELSLIPANKKTGLNTPNLYREVIAIGVFPEGQLRRAFQFYLDEIRVQPYRPLTFYDSWYDLSYDFNLLSEEDCIDRVKTYGDSLQKRNVSLNTFLWDSGWDDWHNMWNFNPLLKNGFKKINEEARKYGASSGAWLSPWGGYAPFLENRLKSVRERYKIFKLDEDGVKKGLTLADPHYYHYFKSVMLDLITNHGVTLFKIDGMGAGLDANGPDRYRTEMQALVRLVEEIRAYYPEVYFNLTVGIWPSPFWLCYADNIWKGGMDYGFVGEGNTRQRWINFRDLGVLKGIKTRSPLCPVSAAMLHGVTFADLGPIAKYESDDAVIAEDIWSFFASGTSLQELYINPHKLNSYTWDVLAKAILWARENKDVLIDANWAGGDPEKGEVYGYAAWSPKRSTLMLRNPSARSQEYAFLLRDVLELPAGYEGHYDLFNVVNDQKVGVAHSERNFKIQLKPFEVMVLNLVKK